MTAPQTRSIWRAYNLDRTREYPSIGAALADGQVIEALDHILVDLQSGVETVIHPAYPPRRS